MHDSEGWKSLETSMRNLQNLIEAIGTHLYAFDLTVILDVIERAIAHLNRFVREISYFVINAILETSIGIEQSEHLPQFNQFAQKLVPLVARGLSDNWSQVRYASSLCSRSFFLVIKRCEDQSPYDHFNSELVPRMCLNRYYVAEGVRNYSIETWKQVFGDRGKQMVCDYAEPIAQFYISQSLADNHAVREAACHCIAEICNKVCIDDEKKEPFRRHIPALLEALVDCFKDESWPVRDAACLACGSFVATFPDESQPKYEELCQIWIAHLSDNIFTVRQHSAQSLAKVFQHAAQYREDLFTRFTEYIDTNILKAKDQPAKSAQFSNLQNETQFGVAKPAGHDHAGHDHSAHDHVHDIEHENKQMFSCGSLAPKLKRGGGCMDHGFARAMEPWELSDGCVYLIKELTMVRCPDDAEIEKRVYKMFEKHATNLADLGFIDHFKHASSLKEQLFKSMFVISSADGLGKKKFRGYVELFLDPAFRNTKHQN